MAITLLHTVLDDRLLYFAQWPVLVKATAFFLVWLVLWLPIAGLLAIVLPWRPFQPLTASQKLPLLASLYLLAPAIVWGFAAATGQSLADLGLNWTGQMIHSAAVGLGAGVLGVLVLYLTVGLLGGLRWQRPKLSLVNLLTTLLVTLLLGVWISATEELVFRGFLQTLLQQAYVPWAAAALSSLVFALLHLVWDRQQTLPQLPGLWLMGMVLTLACWLNHGLGLAWGLHSGWIWTIALLDTTQAITYTNCRPAWLTGVYHQPLASVLGLLFLSSMGVMLYATQ